MMKVLGAMMAFGFITSSAAAVPNSTRKIARDEKIKITSSAGAAASSKNQTTRDEKHPLQSAGNAKPVPASIGSAGESSPPPASALHRPMARREQARKSMSAIIGSGGEMSFQPAEEGPTTPPGNASLAPCMWRQTGGCMCMRRQTGECDPTGPREPSGDKSCTDSIDSGASGFCDCDGDDVQGDTEIGYCCTNGPVTCARACQTDPTTEFIRNGECVGTLEEFAGIEYSKATLLGTATFGIEFTKALSRNGMFYCETRARQNRGTFISFDDDTGECKFYSGLCDGQGSDTRFNTYKLLRRLPPVRPLCDDLDSSVNKKGGGGSGGGGSGKSASVGTQSGGKSGKGR